MKPQEVCSKRPIFFSSIIHIYVLPGLSQLLPSAVADMIVGCFGVFFRERGGVVVDSGSVGIL
jgi:hypothetical protein